MAGALGRDFGEQILAGIEDHIEPNPGYLLGYEGLTVERIQHKAFTGYMNDPVFGATIHAAVGILETETGASLTREERQIARKTACLVLAIHQLAAEAVPDARYEQGLRDGAQIARST